MLRRLLPLLVCSAFLAPSASAAQTGDPSFGSIFTAEDGNSGYSWIVGHGKSDAFVYLEGLEIFYPHPARAFSLHLPLEGAEKGAKIGIAVEGAVALQDKTVNASLIAIVNGAAHVMDFTKLADVPTGDCPGFELSKDLAAAKREAAAKRAREPKSKPNGSGVDVAYVHCIAFEMPSASELRTNIILVISSQNKGQGYINTSTISFAIRPLDSAPK